MTALATAPHRSWNGPRRGLPGAGEDVHAPSRPRALDSGDHDCELIRVLLEAENGSYAVAPRRIEVAEIFEAVRENFAEHDAAHPRRLEFLPVPPGESLLVDDGLLVQVLVNMVKNALEASAPGDTVLVYSRRGDAGLRFEVWNPGFIPREIALRIFQRSFSTKSESGRGIGTYSMKLLGERHLRGNVFFLTDPEIGTTFTLLLPHPEGTAPDHPAPAVPLSHAEVSR